MIKTEKIKSMTQNTIQKQSSQAVAWFQEELARLNPTTKPNSGTSEDYLREQEAAKQARLTELQKQQEEIQKEMSGLLGAKGLSAGVDTSRREEDTTGQLLLEQLRTALAPKEEVKDPNKALLKALLTSHNRATGTGRTSTLKPEILSKLSADKEFSMAEWLATLNKQDEGESEIIKLLGKQEDDSDCRADCRHSKMRSGMLDKSTTNIQRKETWLQKNLGEDWAEEEIEFKQLRFEHLVAGETRTIETCAEPAEILGSHT